MHFTGELSFEVSRQPSPTLKLSSGCRAACQTFPKLRGPFTYTAYHADGNTFDRKTGPTVAGWVPFGETGLMPMAVVSLEDPGFPHHRGYITQAFQNSLVENVQKGRFYRGGSTITQQTAKNLWLRRDKTIGRKIQELFLAQALESCMTKDEILETYLNIVEFGPDVYGIGPGAHFWFRKAPAELTPVEAFWLASILPAPRKAAPPSPASLQRIEKLMASLASQGKIPDLGVGEGPVDTTGWDVAE
jgi:membrane peptidoglycan carboxypeptidase